MFFLIINFSSRRSLIGGGRRVRVFDLHILTNKSLDTNQREPRQPIRFKFSINKRYKSPRVSKRKKSARFRKWWVKCGLSVSLCWLLRHFFVRGKCTTFRRGFKRNLEREQTNFDEHWLVFRLWTWLFVMLDFFVSLWRYIICVYVIST